MGALLGAINEKERNINNINNKKHNQNKNSDDENTTATNENSYYDPKNNVSHLLHSIVGLDRYPNYLLRWYSNINDINKLEDALMDTLNKVKNQKRMLLKQKEIIDKQLYNDIDDLEKNNNKNNDDTIIIKNKVL